MIEQIAQTIQALQQENQKGKDERTQLKGENGRPHFPLHCTNYIIVKSEQNYTQAPNPPYIMDFFL